MNLHKSVYNLTTVPLLAGEEWVGEWEYMDVPDIQINAFADKTCALYIHTKPFPDESFQSEFPSTGYSLNGVSPLYRVVQIGRRQVRLRLVNTSGEDCTVTWVHSSFGHLKQPNAPLNTPVAVDADAQITRSVLIGQASDGTYKNIPATQDGSLQVAVTSPTTAFGEILAENNFPVVQATAVYGIGSRMRSSAAGTGATTGVTGNDFYATSGTGSTTLATIFSKRAVVYKAGQGTSYAFTARYSTPQPNSVMFAGALNGTDNIAIGYLGTQFGIFIRHWGLNEIQELTLTVGATTATNATVTLNGIAYTVPLSIGTTATNAREIATSLNAQQSTFVCTQIGSKVVVRSLQAAAYAGAFTFSHANAVGSFAEITNGVAITEEFIPSYEFTEGDVLNWLDPSKGNVFKIDIQYLGYGDIDFYAEYPNPKQYVLIHRYHYANLNTQPSLTNPSFRIGYTASNRGNTTPITIYGASLAGFNQGTRLLIESANSFSYSKTTDVELAIFSLKVADVIGGKVAVCAVVLEALSVSTDSAKGAIFKLILNPTSIGGSPNYGYYSQNESVALLDVAGTTVTGGRVLRTVTIGAAQSREISFGLGDYELLPNDVLVITAQVTAASASVMTAALTWKEDI